MSANDSQEKLELLIRIADSRLGIIDQSEQITGNIKRQTQRVKTLKKQVLTIPIIATASGVIGSVLLAVFLSGRSRRKAERAAKKQSSSLSVPAMIVKLLMALLIPTAKTVLVNLTKKKIDHIFTK